MNKSVIIWLLSGCFLILIMIIVGGITRLTDSGLSMVTWDLLMGTIPPLNNTEWIAVFEEYKDYPQYQHNPCNLSEFKEIFFWEYLHRLIARILGLVFIIPFGYFLIKKKLSNHLTFDCLILFLMGVLQAGIGWWMVKSGLINNPYVSHYRLAIHLTLAFLIFSYTFWIALKLMFPLKNEGNKYFSNFSKILFTIIILQIIYGAFVAGLDAGKFMNNWPKMTEKWIDDSIYSIKPIWKNFVEGIAGVQFIHRYLAIIILGLIIFMWIQGRKLCLPKIQMRSIKILIIAVHIQIIIGIFTLIHAVPILLAVLHQIGAFILISASIYSLFIFQQRKSTM